MTFFDPFHRWSLSCLAVLLLVVVLDRLMELTVSAWADDPRLAKDGRLQADSQERMDLNMYYIKMYALLGVAGAFFEMTWKITFLVRKNIAARKIHNTMLARVLRAPMAFFDTTPVGRIANRFSSDLNTVDAHLPGTFEWMSGCTFTLILKVITIAVTLPYIVLLAVPVVLIFKYLQSKFVPTMRTLERLTSKARSPIFSFFSETLNGTAVVRAYGAQQRFLRLFQDRCDLLQSLEFTWGNMNRWLNVRMESTGTLVLGTVVLSAVVYRDAMTAGMVGIACTLAMDLVGELHRMTHGIAWLQTQLVSVDRVKEYSEMEVEADWRVEASRPAAGWPQQGGIRVDDLALRYRKGLDLVLKGVTVDIRAGEKVGIVGRTGAGKSSLTLALFRLVEPARGQVAIDGTDIAALGLHDLRSRLTILPQDPVIFAGSLRMNLDPFAEYSDAQVWEALKHAHLHDFVSGLKERLQHECGEGGENLSVGQRQLLCLARTLLHKTRVLVLDEATAAVDMETDDLIQRTIRSEFAHCTVLTIAHRLNTVIDYDKSVYCTHSFLEAFSWTFISTSFLDQNQTIMLQNYLFFLLQKV